MAFQVDEFMNVPEDEVEAAETGGAGEGQAVVEQGNGAETTQTLPAETVQVAEQAVTTDVGQDVATQANDTGTKDAGTGASETEEAQPVADVAAVAPAIIPPRVADPPVAEASTVQKADASIQHEPLPGASLYAFSERIEQGSGDAPDEGVIDQGGELDAAMEAPPISMAVRQSMESDLAPPLPAEPQVTKEAAPPTSAPHQQDPYNRPDLQLSMAALQQAASILQSSNQTDASARNAVSDASQALQNVALLQSMVRLLPTEGLKMKHGRPSRFKGVTPHHSRWQARIKEARRDIHLGYFNTEEAAVRAYDRAVLKFRGAEGLTNLCAADYEEPATVHTPTGVPGKVDAATMTPIDCAESKGANPLPHGYSPEQDDLLPGLMRCPKCGKMKTGDGTQPTTTAAAPPAAPAPRPLPPLATPSPAQTARTNMQMSLAAGPPSPLPSALPSPTALVSQAGLSSTLEAYQSVLGSFGSQTVAEFWSAAAAALSPPNGIGALSPRDAAPAAQKSTTAGPSSSAPPMAPALPSQTAPPLFTRPRPEAIQNVLVHPVTSLATLAAMDALVLREAGIDPELFFNTQKRRALQRTSAYRGITRHHGRWQARIKDQRRDIHLGYFDTEIAAARAYDQAALRYRGTKAQLNFPETDYPPELKQEGERRVAAGALQDVEDPIIAQKRKELLGTLRAERAQAKRQKVLAQGGKPKARRVGGAPGQPDAGELPAGWQGQQGGGLVGAEGTMPLEAVNTEGVQASGVNGSAPVPVQPGLLQLPAPGGELGQVGAEVAQSVAEVEMPGPIPVAESVSVAEDGMAGPIPVAAEVPGVEPWVPGGEGPADQEIHATIPLQT